MPSLVLKAMYLKPFDWFVITSTSPCAINASSAFFFNPSGLRTKSTSLLWKAKYAAS